MAQERRKTRKKEAVGPEAKNRGLALPLICSRLSSRKKEVEPIPARLRASFLFGYANPLIPSWIANKTRSQNRSSLPNEPILDRRSRTRGMEWTQEQIDAEVVRLELTGEKLSTVVETRPFINGRYYDVDGPIFDRIPSINPATGKIVAEIIEGDAATIDMAVAAARTSFDAGVWSRQSPSERKNILLKFAALISDHTLELAVLDAVEGAYNDSKLTLVLRCKG
jgi:hypothetical protein